MKGSYVRVVECPAVDLAVSEQGTTENPVGGLVFQDGPIRLAWLFPSNAFL